MIRVLIVDDNVTLLASMRMFLESYGDMHVETACSADEGIAKLKQSHPHVALLDIVMPNKWGDEVAEMIRNDPDLQNISFAFLTGSRKVVTAQEVSRAHGIIGGNKFLIKGMEPEKLREEILALVKDRPR